MSAIPNELAILDHEHRRVDTLRRVEPETEATLDRIIIENVDLLADALVQAGVLDEGAELRFVAAQFEQMDVLLAEVHGNEVCRLVIVEDKLYRNPQAQREVLSQILDYANRLQYDIDVATLLASAAKETHGILEEQRDQVARIMRAGDFLLLVAGDRIRPRVVELARPLLDRPLNALSRYEMALLSLAVFRSDKDAKRSILVPNVIGHVAKAEREMCFTVVVQNAAGAPLAATVDAKEGDVAAATPARPRARAWNRDAFFEQVVHEVDASDRDRVKHALARVVTLGESAPGLGIRWGKGSKIATFSLVCRTGTREVPMLNFDMYGNGQVNGKGLVELLGVDGAKEAVVALATALGTSLRVDQVDPYLPEDFTMSGDAVLEAFERWARGITTQAAATAR